MNIDQILGMSDRRKPSMLHATMGASMSPRQSAFGWLFRDPSLPFPRTHGEWLVAAIYLLPIFAAAQLVVPTPGSRPGPPLALLVAGLFVGLGGIAYPTRRVVAALLCAYWFWVIATFDQRLGGPSIVLWVLIVVLSGGFLLLCDRIEREQEKKSNVALKDATRAEFRCCR